MDGVQGQQAHVSWWWKETVECIDSRFILRSIHPILLVSALDMVILSLVNERVDHTASYSWPAKKKIT